MFNETFELLNGILCLKCEDSLGDQPTKITRWYPICRAFQDEYADIVGTKAYKGNDCGDYSARTPGGHWIEFRLVDGGQTKPIKLTETPIPCPKSGGKQTRFRNGYWQKLLKTGWVNLI